MMRLLSFLLLASAIAVPSRAHENIAGLAEQLSPAVVNISTTHRAERPRSRQQEPGRRPFDDFFEDFFGRRLPDPGPQNQRSLGSGFIIDSSGLIVTNSHVVPEASTSAVRVTFADGESLDAEVIGIDEKTDIALLKVDAPRSLPFVRFGDSAKARTGDPVIAIGNPFGLGGTVTSGIVSAVNRDIGAGPYDDFIQTDAAINRGSSGGPLFNIKGEVIGVNTVIISPTGGSVGIGFAVPSSVAQPVITQLREFGETRRGWLGVLIQPVTEEVAESLGMAKDEGALVSEVTEGGPAEKSGVRAGDVIVAFNGERVESYRALPRMVADTAVGEGVLVRIFRAGRELNVRVRLGRLEDYDRSRQAGIIPPRGPEPPPSTASLGLEFSPLNDVWRQTHNIPEDVEGVVIVDVNPASEAAQKGVRTGQVIIQVGQKPVRSPDDLTNAIAEARAGGRGTLLLLIWSRGGARFIPLPLAE